MRSAQGGASSQRLAREALARILRVERLEELSIPRLTELVREEVTDYLPDGTYQVDPRNGARILYHSSRSLRPHDNVPAETEARVHSISDRECFICQGQTTGVIDVATLSEGFTFINENLYPILYPFDNDEHVSGLHFLQWTSSHHDKDWHNMPPADCAIVMDRLAALEEKLLEAADFVVIIKNYGHLVGGSLIHGHQQIACSKLMPRHFEDNRRFEYVRGEKFSAHMLGEMLDNRPELIIKDYGPALLLTPYFMRRPFDMMLIIKDTSKKYLHQLDGPERAAVAEGWHDALRAIHAIMPRIGRELAYNVVTSNGPGAGLYFEFLPYTQEIGGVEHLGLFVCQELPERAAAQLREEIDG